MTLDQLKILEQIAETGSIGAAAKALFRTQPTLSVAMKKLEAEFNLKIFARDQYRTTLTPAGRALYEKAKTVLYHAESFESFGKQLALGQEPEIRIAFDALLPVKPILEILKRCQADFPHTKFDLYSENLTGSMERLQEGTVDLAVMPAIESNTYFESISFSQGRIIPVIAGHLPPARAKEAVPMEVMKEYVQVILKDSSNQPPSASYGVLEDGRQWKVNDQHVKKEIIVEGMGWGSLPEYMIADELKSGKLVPLHIENYYGSAEGEVLVARLLGQYRGPVANRLWKYFKEAAQK